jgi:membrane dipeptidase
MNAVDLHVDTLSKLLSVGGGLRDPRTELAVDVPRMQEGGIRALCVACFTADDDPSPRDHVRAMLDLAVTLDHDEQTPVQMVRTSTELTALPDRSIGLIPTIENARSLEGDLEALDEFRERGVAILGITWNGANELAQGCGADTGEGLTPFGREAIERAAALGMAIDISHLNPAGTAEVLALGVPVLATHSNCRGVHDHRRNLDDDSLRALAAADGLLGFNLYPPFLGEDPVKIDRFVEHARHGAELLGVDRLALGSDLDGIDRTPEGFRDHRDLPRLGEALRAGGFTETEVAGILGENFVSWWSRSSGSE